MCHAHPVAGGQFRTGPSADLGEALVAFDRASGLCVAQDDTKGRLFEDGPEFGLGLRHPGHRYHDAVLGGDQLIGAQLHFPFQGGVQVTLEDLRRIQCLVLALDQGGAPTHPEHQDLQQGGEDQGDHPDDPGDPGAVLLQITRRREHR